MSRMEVGLDGSASITALMSSPSLYELLQVSATCLRQTCIAALVIRDRPSSDQARQRAQLGGKLVRRLTGKQPSHSDQLLKASVQIDLDRRVEAKGDRLRCNGQNLVPLERHQRGKVAGVFLEPPLGSGGYGLDGNEPARTIGRRLDIEVRGQGTRGVIRSDFETESGSVLSHKGELRTACGWGIGPEMNTSIAFSSARDHVVVAATIEPPALALGEGRED